MANVSLYEKTMGELQQIWDNENDRLSELHRVRTGIRSTQLGALVMYLIDKGIIKDEKKET